jgi:hypothetical protein
MEAATVGTFNANYSTFNLVHGNQNNNQTSIANKPQGYDNIEFGHYYILKSLATEYANFWSTQRPLFLKIVTRHAQLSSPSIPTPLQSVSPVPARN